MDEFFNFGLRGGGVPRGDEEGAGYGSAVDTRETEDFSRRWVGGFAAGEDDRFRPFWAGRGVVVVAGKVGVVVVELVDVCYILVGRLVNGFTRTEKEKGRILYAKKEIRKKTYIPRIRSPIFLHKWI